MNTNTQMTEKLSEFLASSYTFYLKVQNFHWNIEGKEFFAIHQYTETLYNALFIQVDDIAERIRTLGEKAPGTFTEYLELSFIQEASGQDTTESVVNAIQSDMELLSEKAKEIIALSDETGDTGTSDLFSPYVSQYEKNLWMLKSFGG